MNANINDSGVPEEVDLQHHIVQKDRRIAPKCTGPEPLGSADSGADRQPTVSVLVLNFNGLRHLESCLPSLEAQTYPRDRFEIVVVDNGSTDGSLTFVREHHPSVRIISYPGNRGFAGGYNTATAFCHTDFVAFLNNDTRVAPNWLAELIAAAGRHGAASVASRILDWSGEHIDFAGGIVSLVGHSWQRDAGESATKEYGEDQLLFACGGSMLVRRDAFLDAGGFDPGFFAYFEDVDLGWRMSLLGHTTVFAPSAVTYHRLHGTAGRWALAPRLRLYERNALMMIYKNYERETLARVLPAAIALAVARACAQSPLDPRTFEFGRSIPDRVSLSPRTIAHLIGLEEFASRLPVLEEQRSEIQRRRRRSDADLLPLFWDPLRLHDLGPAYQRTARTLIAGFEIDRWLEAGGRFPALRAVTTVQPDRESAEPARHSVATDDPTVSIVILIAGGPAHLPECLASLRAQSYPADRRDVIVVDNGSAEDPTVVVERHYPGARVIRNGSNVGFAAGNNIGARAGRGEYVAFLNDDTRAHPNWLTELVGAARRRGAACVASQILTWDGQRIDFAGGSTNFEGKGFQAGYGNRVGAAMAERPLFFACGAAMLVDRHVFLDAGGWDEETFAYYEDIELGWRFWLIGEEVWFAPEALVFHKHHGTSGKTAEASRVRLYERNALRMLYTHLEREHLERVLPAALLLSTDRVLLGAGLGRGDAGSDSSSRDSDRWLRRLARAGIGVPRQFKRALAARGAGRHLSLTNNLRRVGLRGLLDAAQSVIHQAMRNTRPSVAQPRSAYLMEYGSPGLALDAREEWVPAGAGAALTGLKEFLDSLPELQRRREWLQARRRRSDLEILTPFNTEWLSVPPAAHQKHHDELHQILADTWRIGEIAAAGSSRAHRTRGVSANRGLDTNNDPSDPPLGTGTMSTKLDHAASRFRRLLVACPGLAGGAGRLAATPFVAVDGLIRRIVNMAGVHALQAGCERVCLHQVRFSGLGVVRQQTSEHSTDAAIRWLGPLSIGGVSREALFCHPTSSLEFRVTGWSGGRAVAWCSLLPETWTRNADGVEFRLAVRATDGSWQRKKSVYVKPRWLLNTPRWYRVQILLPPVTSDLLVTLSTHIDPARGAAYAWAVWGDPRVDRFRPLTDLWRSFQGAVRLIGLRGTIRRLTQLGMLTADNASYECWVAANTPTAEDLRAMAEDARALALQPRISIVTPVYNTDPRWLRACIQSVRRQAYQDWELCLCDDGSTSEATLDVLREAEASDPRVRVTYLPDNRGISGASNTALTTATGDFVAMLDHDDELTPDALYQVVKFLNEHAEADLIYSDEDKLDLGGRRCDPYFKPDWSPEHFLSCMYACHLLVIRRRLMIEVGGFRVGYEGSQDYDLVLRVIARTSRVCHVPKVLYHWRKAEGSAAGSGLAKPWAVDAGRRAIADYAAHAGMDADVEMGAAPGQYRVRHRQRAKPLVSIVMVGGSARAPITSSDAASLLRCVRGMDRTSYENYEVIVLEDGSLSATTRAAIETRRSRCVTQPATEIHLASRVNFGVHQAGGTHVVICCDLVEVRHGDWLTSMLEYSEQPAIGAVGAKLLYPDGRLRHAGVVLGVGGIAALPFHGFPGSSPGYVSSAVGIRNYSAVSGSCLMTRRAVFDEVGGFRAAFGASFGDIDYCLRLHRAGYRVVFTPYAELYYQGPDSGPTLQGDAGEAAEMRRVWGDVLKSDPYYNPHLTTEFVDYRPQVGRPDE